MPKSQIVWEDSTSYSQGERGKIEPRTWKLSLPLVEIVVTKHIHYGDAWILRCPDIGVGIIKLESYFADDAKLEAVKEVQSILKKMSDTVASFLAEAPVNV